jgi:L-ascorbate metabolism protein UlaG (beta-lactamase superfamily)
MMFLRLCLACAPVLFVAFAVPPAASAQGAFDFSREPACESLTATSMGGPAPASPDVVVVRYLGSANHEIAYRNTVLLLNAHYARVPPARPLGFVREDVKKADAILVGHAHGDHMSDAPFVAQRTGAPLLGAPITAEQAKKMGLDEKQIVTVTGRGGEARTIKDVTVEPMLARHGAGGDTADKVASTAFRALQEAVGIARTPEQQAAARAAQEGSRDPRIPLEGVISYLFTFGNDFRIMFRDTSGVDETGNGTEAERAVMKRIGRTDLAIVSYSVLIPQAQKTTVPLVRLYNPRYYMPTHHDEVGAGRLDTPLEPLLVKLRDELNIRGVSPLYRTPVCFNTKTKTMFVGM